MIHISQFYPCSEVDLAGELYYICELGKYCFIKHNEPVSLKGVVLKAVLRNCPIWDFFRIAVHNGYLVDVGNLGSDFEISDLNPVSYSVGALRNMFITIDVVEYDREDAERRRLDYMYEMLTPQLVQISFEEQTEEYWLWSIRGEGAINFNVNNMAINNNRADQAWLSIIAMVAVERFYTGFPKMLLLSINSQVIQNEGGLSYVLILNDLTQCFTGWCVYSFDDMTVHQKRKLQLGYVAWYTLGRDRGMCDRFYNSKEKLRYMKDVLDVQEGDIVLYYVRDKSQRKNYIKSILECHMAKVVQLDAFCISLELINTVAPKFQLKKDFLNNTMAVKQMYSTPPYEHIILAKRKHSIADVGVEYMLYTEEFFITPLNQADDFKVCSVSDGEREDKLILTQNDLVYWVLKDFDYEFNEERFLTKYFKTREPLYTRYMRGEVLEDEHYYKGVE